MVTYEQWNKAIISYFFEDCEPGQIVFLQTDAETLVEIAKQSNFNLTNTNDVIDSLTGAVRDKVIYNNSVDLWTINPTKVSLHGGNCPERIPPQVAFLALTVLAASIMETPRYYEHLNELIFGNSDRGRWQQDELEDIEKFWKHLKTWAKRQRNIELHLTKGTQNRRFVWYPISQCLISKYDEHTFQIIFKEADLKPGAYLAESQLLPILRFCRSFPKLSVKIKRPIMEQKNAEIRLILGQIQLLLENWDGEVQERTSLRTAKRHKSSIIDVQLKSNTFRFEDIEEVRYWFRCRGSSQITFKLNSLNVRTLQPHNDEWFEPFVVDAECSSLQVLQNGVEVKSEETKSLTYKLKPSDIWVFRLDSEPDNGWFSQGNLLLHEKHRIVYCKQLERKVTSFLKQICDEIPIPKSICIAGKETKWQYITIEPTALSDSSLLGFRVTTSDQIRFVGGLPLDRRSNSYFDFCLPTIVVPNHITDSNDPFYMNGRAIEVPSDRRIEFLSGLDSGEYHFSYLDCQSTLRIISAKRSLEHQVKTLATILSEDQETIPTYSVESITEIVEKSGLWVAGAKFFGTDIPEVTWDDVQDVPTEKLPLEAVDNKLLKSPAQLISSIVKLAIELKFDKTSVPEWFNEAIKYIDQNATMRALVQKKLQQYHETALSYTDLRKQGGG